MQTKTMPPQKKTYTQEEAYKSSLAYFKGDDFGRASLD